MRLHDRLLDELGGERGLLRPEMLESAVGAVGASFAGTEAHPGISAKAAAYLWHIAHNHPFLDGNKRTAVTAMRHFLALNGYALTASQDSLVSIAEKAATGEATEQEVTCWVAEHTSRR